jgi:integrase/recombinase XerC/integrase/recombinase XerD
VSVSKDQIKKYILYLKKAKKWKDTEFIESDDMLSSISVQTYVRAIKAWISWMEEEGYIIEPVSSGVKLPKAVKSVIEILTDDEIKIIAKFLDGKKQNKLRDLLIVMLFLECGLRLEEATKLKLKNIQLSQNSLTVLGKGQKERIVSFGVNLQKLIYKYINQERPTPVTPKVDALFLLNDGRPVTQSTIKQLFKRMKRKTGIEKLHPHLLRHTFCTLYLLNNGNIYSLKQQTGHESFEILNNYVHLASTLTNNKTKSLSLLDNMKIKI